MASDDAQGRGSGPEAVAFAQRRRLIEAFTRLAAERGCRRVSADRIAAHAGLPREAFERNFESTQQCLLAAHDAFFDRLAAHLAAACEVERRWAHRVALAVEAGIEFLGETAGHARLFAVEALATGPALLERRYAHIARLAARLREGRAEHPDAAALPATAEWVLVAGALARIGSHLLAEEPALLPALAPELVELLLTPYLGAEEARRIARPPRPVSGIAEQPPG